MLRIRVYEKLHQLVVNGFAERNGGMYRGIPSELLALFQSMNAAKLARARLMQAADVSQNRPLVTGSADTSATAIGVSEAVPEDLPQN